MADAMEVDTVNNEKVSVGVNSSSQIVREKTNFIMEHALDYRVLEILRPNLGKLSEVIRLCNTCKSTRTRFQNALLDKSRWNDVKPWIPKIYSKFRPALYLNGKVENYIVDDVGCVNGWSIIHTLWLVQMPVKQTDDPDSGIPHTTWEMQNMALVIFLARPEIKNSVQIVIVRPGEPSPLNAHEELIMRKRYRSTDPNAPKNQVSVLIRDHRGFDNRDLFLHTELKSITRYEYKKNPHQVMLKLTYAERSHDLNARECDSYQLLAFPSSLVGWSKLSTSCRNIDVNVDHIEQMKAAAIQEFTQIVRRKIDLRGAKRAKTQPDVETSLDWLQLNDPRRVMAVPMFVANPHNAPGGKRTPNKRGLMTPGLDTAVSLQARNVANWIYDTQHLIKKTNLFVIPVRTEGMTERRIACRLRVLRKKATTPSLRTVRKTKEELKKIRKAKLRSRENVVSKRQVKRCQYFQRVIKNKIEANRNKTRKEQSAHAFELAKKIVKRYAEKRPFKRDGGFPQRSYYFNSAPKRLTVNQVEDPFDPNGILSMKRGELDKNKKDDKEKERPFDRHRLDTRNSCLVIGYSVEDQLATTFGLLPCNLSKMDGPENYLSCVKSDVMYGRLLRKVSQGMMHWPDRWWRNIYNYVMHADFRNADSPADWHCSMSLGVAFNMTPVEKPYIKMVMKLKPLMKGKMREPERDQWGRVKGYRFAPPIMKGRSAMVIKGLPQCFSTDAQSIIHEIDNMNAKREKRLLPRKVDTMSLRILVKGAAAFDAIEGVNMTKMLSKWAEYAQFNQGAIIVCRMSGEHLQSSNQSVALFLVAKGDNNIKQLISLMNMLQ